MIFRRALRRRQPRSVARASATAARAPSGRPTSWSGQQDKTSGDMPWGGGGARCPTNLDGAVKCALRLFRLEELTAEEARRRQRCERRGGGGDVGERVPEATGITHGSTAGW
jgi:hypothetical protein